jgi:hypothetical protein
VTLDDLLPLSRRELARLLAEGHAVEPTALDDTEYLGVSLGLPRWVERLTWKKFKKVFRRDGDRGVLRGWNVRVHDSPLDAPWKDRTRDGRSVTWGHYTVHDAAAYPEAGIYGRALMIDYGGVAPGRLDPQRLIRDPLVALNPGDPSLLLGYSYAALGGRRVDLPTFFALVRGGPLTYDVDPPGGVVAR